MYFFPCLVDMIERTRRGMEFAEIIGSRVRMYLGEL